VDGLLRPIAAATALLVLAGGCGPSSAATPSRGTGGLARAVFGSKGSRARLQWENMVAIEANACRSSLRAAGVSFVPMPERARPDAQLCGIPKGVRIARGPSGLTWQPELTVECSFALLLPEVEETIQRAAAATLRRRIARVRTFGTYSCRDMVGWGRTKSEHSFANAIDIAAFDTADGQSITVLRDFYRKTPAGAFLRRLHDEWRASTHLSYVLGPDHDAAHKNHFHIDRGVRWKAF
jgi:hypothetical protein